MSHNGFQAQKIAKLRKILALSQAEFGEVLSTTRETISRWETGNVRPPAKQRFALEVLERLAHRLIAAGRIDHSE